MLHAIGPGAIARHVTVVRANSVGASECAQEWSALCYQCDGTATYHDLAKASDTEYLVNLIRLFLVKRGRLGKQRFCERDGHGGRLSC